MKIHYLLNLYKEVTAKIKVNPTITFYTFVNISKRLINVKDLENPTCDKIMCFSCALNDVDNSNREES